MYNFISAHAVYSYVPNKWGGHLLIFRFFSDIPPSPDLLGPRVLFLSSE